MSTSYKDEYVKDKSFDGPSIITLNWSRFGDLTQPWLEDIAEHTPDPKQVIIVDQGSKDTDVAALQVAEETYSWLDVIYLEENSGFPEGCNIGARAALGNYIVWMNNDIRISGDWWTPMLDLIVRRTEPTIDQKVLVGAHLISTPTGWNSFKVGDEILVIPYLEGWLLAGTRNILTDIGYFDPNFGTGSIEDVDYCYRAGLAGYHLIELSGLPLKHLRGSTVTDGRLNYLDITNQNLLYFIEKVRADNEN